MKGQEELEITTRIQGLNLEHNLLVLGLAKYEVDQGCQVLQPLFQHPPIAV